MDDIGFFANIWYANILQLIWPIIDPDTDIYMYIVSPHLIAEIKSILQWYTYNIIMHTFTVLVHQQMQA